MSCASEHARTGLLTVLERILASSEAMMKGKASGAGALSALFYVW